MSVNGILNKGLIRHNDKWWDYRNKDLCSSAAIYRRKLRRANNTEEILKYPAVSKSKHFPDLTVKEEIKALSIAKGGVQSSLSL